MFSPRFKIRIPKLTIYNICYYILLFWLSPTVLIGGWDRNKTGLHFVNELTLNIIILPRTSDWSLPRLKPEGWQSGFAIDCHKLQGTPPATDFNVVLQPIPKKEIKIFIMYFELKRKLKMMLNMMPQPVSIEGVIKGE